jgi:hypothetical protein
MENPSDFASEMQQLQQFALCYGVFEGLSKVFIEIIIEEDWDESGYEWSESDGEDMESERSYSGQERTVTPKPSVRKLGESLSNSKVVVEVRNWNTDEGQG